MPRSSGRSSGRPAGRPVRRSAPVQAPSRSQSTTAMTAPHHQQPTVPAHPTQGTGFFGNMVSTAAGVGIGSAIGHTIGHGITSIMGGGDSATRDAPLPQNYESQPLQDQSFTQQQQQAGTAACDFEGKQFINCLEQNNGDTNLCNWYLEQLKGCQASARAFT